MKKIISTFCFATLMFSTNLFSQANLTWTLNDKVEGDNFLKTHLTLNTSLSGFANKDESTKFGDYLKTNGNIASSDFSNLDENGNGNLKLILKTPQETMFYLGLAKKLNVGYIVINGEKKTVDALVLEERKKAK